MLTILQQISTNVQCHVRFLIVYLVTKITHCVLSVFLSIKCNDGINKAIRLEITRAQLNPKPHLTKPHTPLVLPLPCQQCSLGNEEWVGVCVTWRPVSNSLGAQPHTNKPLPALGYSSIDHPHFHTCRSKTVVLQDVCELGGGGEEAASQTVVVSWSGNSLWYSPSGLISFIQCVLRKNEHKLMARWIKLYEFCG